MLFPPTMSVFCLASLRPNPISHFNPDPLALGPESQGIAVEIHPIRNGTPLQEQLFCTFVRVIGILLSYVIIKG